MSAIMPNAIPANLSKVIAKVDNYRKSTVKLICDSSSSVGPNGTLRVRFPSNTIIDFGSLIMTCLITFTKTTGGTIVTPYLEQFVHRLDFRVGGESVISIQNFSDLYATLANASMSTAMARTKHASTGEMGPKPTHVLVNQILTAPQNTKELGLEQAGDNAGGAGLGVIVQRDQLTPFATAATTRGSMADFLSLSDLGWVDMSLLPLCELELTFEGNTVLSTIPAGGGAVNDASWAATQAEFTVTTLQFPTWSESLYATLIPDPTTGLSSSLHYKFRRYVNYTYGKDASPNVDLKMNLASQSLDKVFFTCKGTNAYATQAAYVQGNPVGYFTFTNTDTAHIEYAQLWLDEHPIPSYRWDAHNYGLTESLRNLGVLSSQQFDCRVESLAEYRRCKYFLAWVFNDESSHSISGVDTRGASQNMRLHIDWSAGPATGNGLYLVFCQCSAVLSISPGRMISVSI